MFLVQISFHHQIFTAICMSSCVVQWTAGFRWLQCLQATKERSSICKGLGYAVVISTFPVVVPGGSSFTSQNWLHPLKPDILYLYLSICALVRVPCFILKYQFHLSVLLLAWTLHQFGWAVFYTSELQLSRLNHQSSVFNSELWWNWCVPDRP